MTKNPQREVRKLCFIVLLLRDCTANTALFSRFRVRKAFRYMSNDFGLDICLCSELESPRASLHELEIAAKAQMVLNRWELSDWWEH